MSVVSYRSNVLFNEIEPETDDWKNELDTGSLVLIAYLLFIRSVFKRLPSIRPMISRPISIAKLG